ncbi:MAG TPA: serine/threonine-protein kinase [Minicystis sp.]|nr:serine/threonine-protein kinase [Minicystis sp.]
MSISTPARGSLVAGKYRLEERIGGGGMGDVFRATEVGVERTVAIKLLRAELAQSNEELVQRFFQEAQAAARIRHPNVVDVIDAGRGEHGPYLVMEYLEGESLGAALRRSGRLEAEAAIAALAPVLEALDAAHRAGIIHRDLKPENVFLALEGGRSVPVVRLLDFGIAKILDPVGPSPRTRTGVVFGTPDYLSPEQATGETPLDGRSDLFAVGVLFYELVTGSRPFRAATAVATAFRVVHADPPAIATSGASVDPRLEAVIMRLLEKSAAKRFATAADVVRELDAISPDPKRRAAALSLLVTGRRARADTGRSTPPPHLRAAESDVRAARAAPLPSSFPARLRGRFHVRGPVLRAIDDAIRLRFGPEDRDRVVARLAPADAADLNEAAQNALLSVPVEVFDAYLEAATELVLHDVERFRELGKAAVDGALAPLLKGVVRPEREVAAVVRRGVPAWSRLFDFGAWRHAAQGRTRVELRIGELDAASRALRLWLVGVVERSIAKALGADVTCAILLGEMSFAPELLVEIAR